MVTSASVDYQVRVVTVGTVPVESSWAAPWSGLRIVDSPPIVVQHLDGPLPDAASEGAELHPCDLLLSRDSETDVFLRQRYDLVNGPTLVGSDGVVSMGSMSIWPALESWHLLLTEVRSALVPPVERDALMDRVSMWEPRAVQIADARVPAELSPVAETLELMLDADYWATGAAGDGVVQRLGSVLLRMGPAWVGGSLPALDGLIRLRRDSRILAEAELQELTRQALSAAEGARRRGAYRAARCHALTALSLVTHRARHPQRMSSTLVTHTADLVGPLHRDPTLRGLTDASTPRVGEKFVARGGGAMRPSVVILPGPFGEFHLDMVAALSAETSVTVSELRQSWPELRRRRPVPQDLSLLAALREGRVDLEEGTLDGQPIDRPPLRRAVRCLRRLKIELSHHDVAISDWGDVATMWASHVCPRGTRLVTRWHSLDLFDPWLHLVDWRGVDEVLISNPALGSLFSDLTSDSAAPAPVVIHPYLPDLSSFEGAKADEARFTIAMVGWGRMVKDPAFALDLLDRDPRRRLILIGPPFSPTASSFAQEYADGVSRRLEDEGLRSRVDIVGPTDDVARHLRGAGIILSSSFREGWHLGLIEGIASGAVPVVRDWPMLAGRGGAASLYPHEWVVADLDEADRRIAALADRATWGEAAELARTRLMRLMDPTESRNAYQRHVLGDQRLSPGRGEY
ncbi:MAG: hypothetical protein WA966_02210 [Ornithinimicrobium sp.]